MAAGRFTSRVFVAGEAIHAALAAATFPAHPTGFTPQVFFADEHPDDAIESIIVALDPDATSTEWRRMSPAGRDESLRFLVTIRTMIPAVETSAEVWDRLEELTAVVEGIVFDTATESVIPLGFDGEVDVPRVASVAPSVSPGPQGWIGGCVVAIECLSQI